MASPRGCVSERRRDRPRSDRGLREQLKVMATLSPSTPVKSALRTLDILELLAQQARPMTAQEIAVTLGIPVSSLSYLLSTLVERGYLDRARREYRLGPAVARLSGSGIEPS